MATVTKPYHTWGQLTFQNLGDSTTWIGTFWSLGAGFNLLASAFTAVGFNTLEAMGLVLLTVPAPLALAIAGARAHHKLRRRGTAF